MVNYVLLYRLTMIFKVCYSFTKKKMQSTLYTFMDHKHACYLTF